MKKNYTSKMLLGIGVLLSGFASAQCPAITCPSNITVSNDSAACGAVVTFAAPSMTDPCAVTTQTFNYSGAIVNWTVPVGVTSIRIEARGAQGSFNTSSTIQPGMGASMAGDFVGNGGGGGTFVTDMSNNPMIIAGGGGGSSGGTDSPDKHGQAGTTGGTGAAGGGTGGTAGSGGNVGVSGFQSGAGGGLLTNGADGWTAGSGGFAFVNGGAGANVGFGIGGFGGGGNGSGYVVGGGGGGYSGGGSGGNSSSGVGGGGGSYNGGTNQVNAGGVNTGNGLVTITYTGSGSLSQTQIAGLTSGSTFPVGTTVQTFVATDGLGNYDTCSFTVTVNDAESPVISCPSNITVNADSGMCSTVVTYAAPNAIDNCSIDSTYMSAGLSSGSAFPVGTTTVSYTTMDASGNSVSCSFDITVTDNQSPVFTCPGNMAVNADSGMCSAVVNYSAPVATDNCSVASASMTGGLASGSTFPLGTTTITYTATDSAGNSSTCSFDIVVSDSQAPVMTCPGTMTVPADSGNCSAVVTFNAPSATDNCSSASVSQTGGLPSGSAFPVGTTTITYTATDSAGNSSTCSFDIIVTDNQAPVLTCPIDISSCSPVVSGLTASASDMCSGIDSLTYTLTGATTGSGTGDASGTTFNIGSTIVTYTATDSSGNSSTCNFTVTVNPLPVLTVSASSTTVCVSDGPVALTGTPAGGTWSGPGVTGSTFNPATAGTGTQTATYSYTDSNGCTNTADLVITVNACVGVVEIAGINGLQVYPNPTQGNLQIVLGAEYAKVDLRIAQINGQIVQQEQFSKTSSISMSLENLATGIYFLTINADDQVRTVKLIRN
ncbi:MAG: hypothetical protein FD123_2834 [Bacteroidetes bacterium]|nr:MAG: hypothetical protein FD123_2834 [Bacteroidota bacterium]